MARGEVFYFDYGCLAFWGLSERQEREVLGLLVRPLPSPPRPGCLRLRAAAGWHAG